MNNESSSNHQGQDQNHLNEQGGPNYKYAHPLHNLLIDINTGIIACSLLINFFALFLFVFHIEPKHYAKALEDPN